MKKRNSYSKQFKLEAVRLLEEGVRTGADVARELGVRRSQLYLWKAQIAEQGSDQVFQGAGRRSGAGQSSELAQLRKENAQLRQERDILKKAAAYFARELP